MQTAAQESFEQRKASNWKPVATSDKETLEDIRQDMNEKRRFRDDESDLGNLSYTKRSAKGRYEAGGIDDFAASEAAAKGYQNMVEVPKDAQPGTFLNQRSSY